MARKNIFAIISESFDIGKEILTLEELFSNNYVCYCENPFDEDKYETITKLVDLQYYSWKGRKTTVRVDDLKKQLMIPDIFECIKLKIEINENESITCLEYYANILHLFKKFYAGRISSCNNLTLAEENLQYLIDQMNLKALEIEEFDGVELVLRNPLATMVAESLPQNIALQISRYHHHLLKGDLEAKVAILVAMGKEYETIKSNLEHSTYNALARDIGTCLNNLKIRHSNHDKIASLMTDEELEEWYDYTVTVKPTTH